LKFPKPTICDLCFTHEYGSKKPVHPCGYNIKQVDAWREALHKFLLHQNEIRNLTRSLTKAELLDCLLEEWL